MKEIPIRKRKVYKGKAVDFCVDKVRLSNDITAVREYMRHPGAVAVIAFPELKKAPVKIKKSDRIILVKQFRYPVKRSFRAYTRGGTRGEVARAISNWDYGRRASAS